MGVGRTAGVGGEGDGGERGAKGGRGEGGGVLGLGEGESDWWWRRSLLRRRCRGGGRPDRSARRDPPPLDNLLLLRRSPRPLLDRHPHSPSQPKSKQLNPSHPTANVVAVRRTDLPTRPPLAELSTPRRDVAVEQLEPGVKVAFRDVEREIEAAKEFGFACDEGLEFKRRDFGPRLGGVGCSERRRKESVEFRERRKTKERERNALLSSSVLLASMRAVVASRNSEPVAPQMALLLLSR